MKSCTLTRREIIARLGCGAAAIPLLHTRASGADPIFPRRLVIFNVASCGPRNLFWPRGSETDFTLPELVAPLEDLKSKLLFVGGLGCMSAYEQKNFAVHEAHHHLLTGATMSRSGDRNGAGGPSLDWAVANKVPAVAARPFPQLVVGFNYEGNGNSRAAPSAPGQSAPEITRRDSPTSLFDQVLKGRVMTGSQVDPALQRLRDERKSVLDYLGKSVEGYATRLGTEDRQKIAFHQDGLRQLEKGLAAAPVSSGCSPGIRPTGGDFSKIDSVPGLIQQQLDVVAAALSCDLTRVVSLQWSHDGGNRWNYPWLGPEFSASIPRELDPAGTGIVNQHYLQHQSWSSPVLTAMRVKMEGWWVKQFAYLARKLANIQEGAGSVLDNTALVFLGAQGLPSDHLLFPLPVIVAGGCGGFFKTGRFVRLGTRTDYDQPETVKRYGSEGLIPHNRFLVSLANAMGLNVNTFGVDHFTNPLTELRA